MPDVIYEKRERFAIFKMNRPERLNALGGTLRAEMEAAVDDFNEDPNMRVSILTGEGRAFCAGFDLREGAERADRGEQVTGQQTRTATVPRLLFSGSPSPSSQRSTSSPSAAGWSRRSTATSASCPARPSSACRR